MKKILGIAVFATSVVLTASAAFAVVNNNPVPEPGTIVLMGVGLLGLLGLVRKHLKK